MSQALHEHTRVTPIQRHASLRKFVDNVNGCEAARAELDKWGLELDNKTLEVSSGCKWEAFSN